MRYLKSAALLLLTASSSVSLFSAVAKAEQGIQDSNTQERIAPSLTAETSVTEPVNAGTAAVASSSIMTPIVDKMRSPRFDLLRTRLMGSQAQPLPIEIATRLTNTTAKVETERVETESAVEVTKIAVEVIDNTALPTTLPTALPPTALPIALPMENSGQGDSQLESFIQLPTMTLDSFREAVEAADREQAQVQANELEPEATTAEATTAETTTETATTETAIDNGIQLAQETTDSLPVLEETEPAVDPEAEGMEEEGMPPEVAPPGTAPTETEDTDAEEMAPAESVVEIEGLPETLFADPNPLSFPTQPSEVGVDQNPVVTIEQAIALAYQNNQALQASILSLEQAEAGVEAARAANRPTVTSQATLETVDQGPIEPSPADPGTSLQGRIEIAYDVFTGGSRAATIRAAELQRDISALTVEAQQEQIRLVTANTYYDLQNAGEQIRINQSFLDEAARNLRDAQLRQEVGVGTRFDTLRAEVQFANARQALIQAQGSQRIARRDIARLLNLPPTSGLTTTPVEVAETWPLTLEESILQAFQNRAELEQQLLQADISEQQRIQALAAIRPQISLFTNYNPAYVFSGLRVRDGNFQDDVRFGARLNWSLYDGGAAVARARQQELGRAIAEEQFSETLDQVRFDVEQAYFNLETNQENILTSQVAVAQAEEALALANLRLQAGVGTQLDVLTAQSELTEAEGNNVAAVLGYNRALVAIERAISNVAAPF